MDGRYYTDTIKIVVREVLAELKPYDYATLQMLSQKSQLPMSVLKKLCEERKLRSVFIEEQWLIQVRDWNAFIDKNTRTRKR